MIPAPLQKLIDRLAVAWHERAVALKAVSFAIVGVVNSAVDFGVFSFAYYYLALPIVVANTLAWIVAVTCSYVSNSTITFAAESGRRLALKRYFAFAFWQVAGFLANTATVWCLVDLGARARLGRQSGGDRGQLRGQFLALAFRGVPGAQTARMIPKSLSSNSIGDGNRFSDKITRKLI